MLIAIAIAEEIQWLQRIAKRSASFDLLSFLWLWQEIFRKLGNFLPKSRKTQNLKTCRTFLSFAILGSLLQWRWQWASIGQFVFLFYFWNLLNSSAIALAMGILRWRPTNLQQPPGDLPCDPPLTYHWPPMTPHRPISLFSSKFYILSLAFYFAQIWPISFFFLKFLGS